MAWLPADFAHPTGVPVGAGYHLRPITAADADLDYPAVMGSQARLWSIFGPAWEWPAASMTYEHDAEDLARHEAGISWWVVDGQAGTGLERDLDALVPRWIAGDRPSPSPATSAATCRGQTGSPSQTPPVIENASMWRG